MTARTPATSTRPVFVALPVLALAAVKVTGTMAFANGYGWHRDELYYLACARHLALGYVDFPALVPLLARVDQTLFPGSLPALRVLPALGGAAILVVAAAIARELGGGAGAQVLAAFAVLISPLYIGANALFQTVTFDQMVWAVLCWLLVRILVGGDPRLWLLFGLVFGVGLETKFTVIGLGAGVLAGLLLTPARRHLATRWPWLGLGISLLLLAPNLWWQAGHSWDSVRYTISHHGNTDGPVAYWAQQLLLVGPLHIPLVVLGFRRTYKDVNVRALFWTAVTVELLFFASGGKAYYPAPIYALLYAAGSISLAQFLARGRGRWMLVAVPATLSALLLPIGLPVLPAQLAAQSVVWKARKDFADEYGWPELARQVQAVHRGLPASERGSAMVLAENYGEAGALDLYGPDLGLPAVVSPHLTYYYWAPPRMDPQTVISVGYSRNDLRPLFADVEPAGTISNAYGVQNEEYGRPIFVCRRPRRPLSSEWQALKRLD
jgi:Dolichyl-phosphate-mannose-protein mannosyltransferase